MTLSRPVGRALSGLSILFLTVDALMKLFRAQPAVAGTTQLGFSAGAVPAIGLVLLVCVAAYLLPPTSTLGAVLLTGYLGGAVAVQVRNGNALFSQSLFPLYVAVLVWGGLFLRDDRVRAAFSPWERM